MTNRAKDRACSLTSLRILQESADADFTCGCTSKSAIPVRRLTPLCWIIDSVSLGFTLDINLDVRGSLLDDSNVDSIAFALYKH
jgi:hypothetical protein